jgi:hypothetical protein
VNGTVGFVVAPQGHLTTAMTFTTNADRISRSDIVTNVARLAQLNIDILD